jgi:type I restriction enzyme S subunit
MSENFKSVEAPIKGSVSLGALSEKRVEQSGPLSTTFTYIDIGSIDRETKRIIDPKILPIEKAPSRAKQLLKAGDVLVSMTRPNLNAVALVQPTHDGAIASTGFHVLRPKNTDPRFLFYAVQSPHFIDAQCLKVQGALYPAVRPRDISSFEIPAFDISDQRRIVAEIEKQFTRLEAGVAALKRVEANLKRYRAAVLKAACEGRLVETEAELARKEDRSYETGAALLTRILSERRKNWQGRGEYKEPVAPEADGLGTLPKGWVWSNAEQLHTLVTSGSRGWGDFYSDSGPLFIRAQDIKTDSLNLSGAARVAIPEKAEGVRSSVQNGDLLITITEVARVAEPRAPVFK